MSLSDRGVRGRISLYGTLYKKNDTHRNAVRESMFVLLDLPVIPYMVEYHLHIDKSLSTKGRGLNRLVENTVTEYRVLSCSSVTDQVRLWANPNPA